MWDCAVMRNIPRAHAKWVHIAAFVIGIGGVVFGLYWGLTHVGEPEIFSPALFGYVGIALILYNGWRLVANRRQPHP